MVIQRKNYLDKLIAGQRITMKKGGGKAKKGTRIAAGPLKT